MAYFEDRVVWITGASSGIGEALARAWVKAGSRVILSARREEELRRVKASCSDPSQVYIAPLDLSQSESFGPIVKHWINELGQIDILVNNGGISQRGLAAETDLQVDRRIMEVNYFGQVALTKAVLPHMLARGRGQIVVISSLTGKFGFPLRSAYAASKHALHGFFETLLLENYDRGLRVTLVNPGRVHTQVSVNALTQDGSKHGEMDPGQAKGMSAETCARHILRAVRREKAEINLVWPDKVMVYLKRYLPGLFRRLARRVKPQ